MSSLLPRASLKRSPRTRVRKDNVCAETISRSSSILTRRKTRPPPLQIIPEMSDDELDFNATASSPATARPTQSTPRQSQLHFSRVTLSAYTFSIDDALLMFSNDSPRSPALSASSSTSDGASSEDVLSTPGTSDDEDADSYMLPVPRLRPQRISIRPLCINKTRSLVCQEEDDIHNHFEMAEEEIDHFPMFELPVKQPANYNVETGVAQEEEQDFYAREFEDFISLSPVVPSPRLSARRDSLIFATEIFSAVVNVPELPSQGRSRHSKPLPLLPPTTPPVSSLPSIPTFPLVQTTARTSIVRRKRNVPSFHDYSSPSPAQPRPLPRVAIPLDIEDCIFSEENLGASRGPIVAEQVCDADEDAGIYSQSSIGYRASAIAPSFSPAVPETPVSGMYGEVALPRASTDSDAPRSSVDSALSFTSSASSNTPISPYSFPGTPSSECHEAEFTQPSCSRWSSSTLASVDIEPTRSISLLSPLRSVLGARARQVAPPSQKSPPRTPPQSKAHWAKRGFSRTPSPPSTPEKSRSSTSSTECDSLEGSPSGIKRKPIPVAMFLRAA